MLMVMTLMVFQIIFRYLQHFVLVFQISCLICSGKIHHFSKIFYVFIYLFYFIYVQHALQCSYSLQWVIYKQGVRKLENS